MKFPKKSVFNTHIIYFSLVVVLSIWLAGSSYAGIDVPKLLNYQGYLSENGLPINNTVNLTFRLYTAPTGEDSLKWKETQNVVVVKGRFSVLLGGVDPQNNPLPFSEFYGGNLFLGIQVENDTEMVPRQQIVSVAYAMFAQQANGSRKALTAGETINGAILPVPVCLKSADTKIYACNAADADKLNLIGFAISNAVNGETLDVQFEGVISGFNGLNKGVKYYLQDTSGTIDLSVGIREVLVGVAISDTELLMQKGTMEFIGSANANGNSDTLDLQVPPEARFAVITVSYKLDTNDGSPGNGMMYLARKGVTSGSIDLNRYTSGNSNGFPATASWVGSIIKIDAGGNGYKSITAYFYR